MQQNLSLTHKERLRLATDFPFFAANALRIIPKDKTGGAIVPFQLNKAQLYIHDCLEKQFAETGMIRAIILKGRQQGCSTYTEGRFFWKTIHHQAYQTVILTHLADATANLFSMTKRYLDLLPEQLKPTVNRDTSKELFFPKIESGFKCMTAGSKGVGRSATIQLFHGSEVAFWPHAEEHAAGVLQAVPLAPGTEIVLESTANGQGNYFHKMWQEAEAGQSNFQAIFIPWYWQDEYRMRCEPDFELEEMELELKELYGLDNEQIRWRRFKIQELGRGGSEGERKFKQEYPMTATEAFQASGEDSFIDSIWVERARKCREPERIGPKILACDPARFGDDRTAIIRRQGRVSYGLETYSKLDTMQVVGLLRKYIIAERPSVVFIDVGGLGAGIVDRLHEMGFSMVEGVNFGERANLSKRYPNRRCEMWDEMKEWLTQTPCKIPDTDELSADLTNVQFKYDSLSRVVLEKKEDMKKRGIRSPDAGDVLALTFARNVGQNKSDLVKKLWNPGVTYI